MSANKFEHLSLLTEMIKSSLVHDMHPIVYFENHLALPLWQHHPTPLSQAALPFSRDLQARLVSRVGHQYPEVKYRSAFISGIVFRPASLVLPESTKALGARVDTYSVLD